jgi:hypothetical protein
MVEFQPIYSTLIGLFPKRSLSDRSIAIGLTRRKLSQGTVKPIFRHSPPVKNEDRKAIHEDRFSSRKSREKCRSIKENTFYSRTRLSYEQRNLKGGGKGGKGRDGGGTDGGEFGTSLLSTSGNKASNDGLFSFLNDVPNIVYAAIQLVVGIGFAAVASGNSRASSIYRNLNSYIGIAITSLLIGILVIPVGGGPQASIFVVFGIANIVLHYSNGGSPKYGPLF